MHNRPRKFAAVRELAELTAPFDFTFISHSRSLLDVTFPGTPDSGRRKFGTVMKSNIKQMSLSTRLAFSHISAQYFWVSD
jgi:hypothetical protein